MPSIKELKQQRKNSIVKKKIPFRIPITAVLVVLGTSIIFMIGSFLNPHLFFPIGAGLFILFVITLVFYEKKQTHEEKAKKIPFKTIAGTTIFMILMFVFIFLGFSFFIDLSENYTSTSLAYLVLALVIYFSFLPFIMALWYKTSPGLAVRLIVRLRKAFNWKTKTKISEFIVLETPQDHSFFVTLKRTFTSMIFSIFTVFTLYDPLSKIIQIIFFQGSINHSFDLSKPGDLVTYCMIFLLTFSILTVASFFLFFWLLPSTFLLDDAGVVCYNKYLKRRAPPEIKSISNWFLSLMTSIVGTSAIIAYIYFILNNIGIVVFIHSQLGSLPAVEFSIFFLGFPFFGTILMSYILLLFQESQFNKLKTFVYQELINIKIDPRIVKIKLYRENEFQERSLLDYPGENIKHNPSLQESVSSLPASGELDESELVKK